MASLALCCRPSGVKYEAYSEVTSDTKVDATPRSRADGVAKSKKAVVLTSAAERDSNVRDAPRGRQDSSAQASSKPARNMRSSGTQTVVRVVDHLPSNKATCSSPVATAASPEATVTTPLKTAGTPSDADVTPSRVSKGGSSRKTPASGGKSLADRPIWRV